MGSGFIWQQDGAPIHTAKIVQNYLKDYNTLTWPSRSPDLSIIENIWHLLELQVYKNKQYTTDDDLWQAIVDASTKIKKDVILALYASIPRRLLQLYNKKGDELDY